MDARIVRRPRMKTGKIYRHINTSRGETVTLRALKWEDLEDCVVFINDLVGEKDTEPNLGIMADRKQTREEEAEWLASQLTGIEKGNIVSVVAEVRGRLVGNSSVTKGSYEDTRHHGYLGIAISKKHRDHGIGLEMMRTLVRESRRAGLKTVQLEVFANNPRAIHVYERADFKESGRIPKKMLRSSKFTDSIVMTREL
ncbi:MAG TPA: GNAT family N-acetyltransferase [Candidatus Bathyarchaeia archaeon]|nr:GNAT family N-acetyltransferase [Candidatus Bathyarchaeia archaeon]